MKSQLISMFCVGLLLSACGDKPGPAMERSATQADQERSTPPLSADLSSIVTFDAFAIQLAENQGLADINVGSFVTPSNPEWRTEWLYEPLRIAVALPAQDPPSLGSAFDLYYQLRGNEAAGVDEVLVNVEFRGYSLDPKLPSVNIANGCIACEWSIENTKTRKAWAIAPDDPAGKTMGEGVDIAHLDTGYTRHPEMIEEARLLVKRGYDYFENDDDPTDEFGQRPSGLTHFGHGTATGSVIASGIGPEAAFPNGYFVTGIAPKSSIIPIRVDNDVVIWKSRRDVKGIAHAVREAAHIISMSRAGLSSKTLKRAVDDATRNGIIVVAAPGNCVPTCGVYYPAKLRSTIAPAATDEQSIPWKESGRGKQVDISAPGHGVWRAKTDETGQYHVEPSSGTSYATANTAGAAALWLAYHGGWTKMHAIYDSDLTEAFRTALTASGVNPWPDPKMQKRYGTGTLNTQKLLSAPLPDRQSLQGHDRTAAGPAQGSTDSIAEALDIEDAALVEQVIARLLRKSRSELPAIMDDVGHEIALNLFADIELQRSFLQLTGLVDDDSKNAIALYNSTRNIVRDRASMRLKGILDEGVDADEVE